MKRIYLLMILFVAFVSGAFAQRTIDVELKTLVKPTAGSFDITKTQPVEYIFNNKGPGALMAGDTLTFRDPYNDQNEVWFTIISATKNMGDTLWLKYTRPALNPSSVQSGAFNYCVTMMGVRKGSANTAINGNDTSNDRKCVGITIVGGTASVPHVDFSNKAGKETLTIAPNPATAEVKFSFVATSNAEVTARVMDITGRVVYAHSYGAAYAGQSNYSLNIANLNQGIYFVELSQDDRRAIGKLIKQ